MCQGSVVAALGWLMWVSVADFHAAEIRSSLGIGSAQLMTQPRAAEGSSCCEDLAGIWQSFP